MKNCEIYPEEIATIKLTYGFNQPYYVHYLSLNGVKYLWNDGNCKILVNSQNMFWKNEKI